ncbi:uncharacterized protein LOC134182675 [Corticium candelabrum]|uniref:uncharacterized protein LOC134182675 n=1 Tax=Corticium candelabrum TaxID=121492 RepID=UPI002E26CF8C|nr:uncharacterized protein LOC134182675 [Corticium candelabrum]XP_062506088.1 uncharacterized protein LOC134182675 [Corticium candelabrum]XP_062506089.1 uncharacterized protein LOC134182675 [Corticium candelabrum]
MEVVGLVTDGEFKSLRSLGSTGPTNILQIRSDSRAQVSRLSYNKMLQMLTLKELSNPPEAVVITREILMQSQSWQKSGLTYWDSIAKLRIKTVPRGFTLHAWNGSLNTALETRKDCLRSIIAQLFYRHKILDPEKQGQNFLIFAYQPEIDKVTGQPFHEREDHNHVLKRIASHTRSSGPKGCHLER